VAAGAIHGGYNMNVVSAGTLPAKAAATSSPTTSPLPTHTT
jgi:hypothetical protein